jgi:dephospho-CoA kinase
MAGAPPCILVTGGIAAGKSAVCGAFARLGIGLADADEAARGVLAADGGLDRTAMRQRIFEEPAARAKLEAIVHPRVRAWLRSRVNSIESPYALVAVPLFAESGGRAQYDWIARVLLVHAPLSLQRSRLLARDGIDPGLAARMIAAQATPERRLALADDVIVNDAGLAVLDAAVERLHRRYLRLVAS